VEIDNDMEEERSDDKQDNGHNEGGVKVKVVRGDVIVNNDDTRNIHAKNKDRVFRNSPGFQSKREEDAATFSNMLY
jgi:hypothetical protein